VSRNSHQGASSLRERVRVKGAAITDISASGDLGVTAHIQQPTADVNRQGPEAHFKVG
jgi:hypothetical protein